jgi:hypothetical protein
MANYCRAVTKSPRGTDSKNWLEASIKIKKTNLKARV